MVEKSVSLESYNLDLIKKAIIDEVQDDVRFDEGNQYSIEAYVVDVIDEGELKGEEMLFPLAPISIKYDKDNMRYFEWKWSYSMNDHETQCKEVDDSMLANADMGSQISPSLIRY